MTNNFNIEDFLDMSKEDIIKQNNGKKFDIVLMNPPYSGSLHLKFLEKTIKIADNVISIQPIRWLEDPRAKYINSSAFNKYNKSIIDYIYDLEVINSDEASEKFNTTITMNCGIYVCNKNGGWKNIFENNILDKIIKKTKGIPTTSVKNVTKKCFCLVTMIDGGHRERKKTKGSGYNIIRNEKWYGKYYVNGISDNGYSLEENKKRNKMATNGNINNWPCVEFDTEKEAYNFYKFSKTKLFKYVYKLEMVDVNVNPKLLPWMEDYTHEWTDKQLYKYFNLTDNEIEIIENEINETI